MGDYVFSVVATDGMLSDTAPVTLQVVRDSNTATRISGVVQDPSGTPLAGVLVAIARLSVLTDSTGAFTIEFPESLIPTESFEITIPAGDPIHSLIR